MLTVGATMENTGKVFVVIIANAVVGVYNTLNKALDMKRIFSDATTGATITEHKVE